MLSDRTATVIIYLVASVWGVSMVISMIPGSSYRPDPVVHGIFTTIVGGAMIARNRADDRNDRTGGGSNR